MVDTAGLPFSNPLLIIAIGLGTAFLLGFIDDRRRGLAFVLSLAALASMTAISAEWLLAFAGGGLAGPVILHTAGTPPPFAISLRMGMAEAALTLLIHAAGLFTALAMKDSLIGQGRRAMAVLLIMVMALSGIVLTRDLFNLFVFVELVVIASAGLLLLSEDARAVQAGFKYLMAAQFISALLLIGMLFAYHAGGSLGMDDLIEPRLDTLYAGTIAFFLMFAALAMELKPFPANGWALDIYESAHPAFSALLSAAAASAMLFAVDKLLDLGGSRWLDLATGIGIVTFVVANILALPQANDRRLLGYSSLAQTGLVLVVIGQRELLGEAYAFVAFGILVAHAVAKAGLYWISGLIAERDLAAWAALRERPWMLFAFATFLAMLIGLPPFPGFYAKWELAHALAADGQLVLLGLILFGALIESVYLFRWFGQAVKHQATSALASPPVHVRVPVLAAAVAGWGLGYLWGDLSGHTNLLLVLPLLFALAFLILEGLPAWIKNSLAIAGLVAHFVWLHGQDVLDPLRLIFAVIFLLGGAIVLLASFEAHGRRIGFYPSAMLMYAGLAMLVVAETSFDFFAAWELLTVGSYFLILRGRESEPHALSYLLFSLGGAFLILAGFALAAQGASVLPLAALGELAQPLAPWVFLLLAIGFMTKTAALGVHIWLPGAHAEAETDVSPMVSGILLKAGLFGLFLLLMHMGRQELYGIDLTHTMLWIGALTALIGNLMAAFQEDAKRLLAWSSIGQMGYALFGLALMNPLGWLMALMFVINHYIYKSMLFLSVGGVAKRTGTRLMYRMGGLITLMPLSFVAVLIGIIAISGVPPLSGFGGRWIFYNAILDSEARLPLVILFLAGPIAFLYLFRLIHTIFLGQLKDEHRRLREAPFWIVLPQMLFVAMLLVVAVVPGLVLRHVDAYIAGLFGHGGLDWSGMTILGPYGWWNPVAIMIIVGVIFMTLFAWLLFVNRRAQKVKQFNIVFSAERPCLPETTHFAWNFFAPYRKALGFLATPLITRFWQAVADGLHGAGDLGRRIYTGNGQTYAYHLLAFVLAIFMLGLGGLT